MAAVEGRAYMIAIYHIRSYLLRVYARKSRVRCSYISLLYTCIDVVASSAGACMCARRAEKIVKISFLLCGRSQESFLPTLTLRLSIYSLLSIIHDLSDTDLYRDIRERRRSIIVLILLVSRVIAVDDYRMHL